MFLVQKILEAPDRQVPANPDVALGYLGLTIFHEEVGAVNTVLWVLGVLNLPAWFSSPKACAK
mgnify:CR=1 FL=1